jgi:hypothetical protein
VGKYLDELGKIISDNIAVVIQYFKKNLNLSKTNLIVFKTRKNKFISELIKLMGYKLQVFYELILTVV